MKRNREQQLIDIGTTTALAALTEILESRPDAGVLARQALAMLGRLKSGDRDAALIGFCDELEGVFSSVPGMRTPGLPRRTMSRDG